MSHLRTLPPALFLALACLACGNRDEAKPPSPVPRPTPLVTPVPIPRAFTTASGVSVVEASPRPPPTPPPPAPSPAPARFRFVLADPAGKELDAGVIEFTPGGGETFPWLEEVAQGMNPGALRRAEVPPGLAAGILPDDTSRTLALEIERLD